MGTRDKQVFLRAIRQHAGHAASTAPARHTLAMEPARHPCPACGLRVHAERCGSGATCPVCGWVDDLEQLAHPDLVYGANSGLSLRDAQARSRAAGQGAAVTYPQDEHWRPLRPGETPPADPEGPSSPVCYVGTPDRSEFVPYWRRGRLREP
jgi:hypothetical protein